MRFLVLLVVLAVPAALCLETPLGDAAWKAKAEAAIVGLEEENREFNAEKGGHQDNIMTIINKALVGSEARNEAVQNVKEKLDEIKSTKAHGKEDVKMADQIEKGLEKLSKTLATSDHGSRKYLKKLKKF